MHAGTEEDLAALERLAVDLATGAAEVVRAGHHDAVSAKSSVTDLVTETDRAAEQWLRQRLAEQRPDDAVLGEEAGGRPGTSGFRWLLDPIDGTVNFVLGLPQYAVSVAVERDGATLAGAVCNPATGETFSARRGGGARGNGIALTGPRQVPLDRAVVGTGFSYDAAIRRAQAEVLVAVLPRVADVRRLGAASLDLCAVAAGHLDAYYEVGLHPWDHAAGALVAAEAGCVVRQDGELIAAAGPALAEPFFALLDEVGAAAVSSRATQRASNPHRQARE